MTNIFPSHIRVYNDGTVNVQSCTEHSRNTAQYASAALENIGLSDAAYLAGILHDCGKYKEEFKNYLERSVAGEIVHRGSVIHTFAGAKLLLEEYHSKDGTLTVNDMVCEILAYAVGAHHGLFDCVDVHHKNGFAHRYEHAPPEDRDAIIAFFDQCASKSELNKLFSNASNALQPWFDICSEIFDPEDNDEFTFLCGLIVRLLTSAVIEGDRRDTAVFMDDVQFPKLADQTLWSTLLDRVERKLDNFPNDTPINQARRQISDCCRAAAEQEPGIYRLHVPTGGGKTLSSLRYALAHARYYKKQRIIFVSPLLSILDQNSRVIRDMLEDDDIVLEHHSNVITENF